MHAATIVPQRFLSSQLWEQPYHMALAHLIQKTGFDSYTKFYAAAGYDTRKFLIMDNGLIEGDMRPIEELVEKAQFIRAQEFALPDVFEDRKATLKLSHSALEYRENHASNLGVMAIAQGENVEDWIECAKEMLTWPIQSLGIPKVLVRSSGRDARIHALEGIQEFIGDKQIHLLGCWETPIEIKMIENYVRAGKIKPVRGVDSAIAYVYAREGLRMCDAERPTGTINFNDSEPINEMILKFNIDMWQKECASLPPLGEQDNVVRPFI